MVNAAFVECLNLLHDALVELSDTTKNRMKDIELGVAVCLEGVEGMLLSFFSDRLEGQRHDELSFLSASLRMCSNNWMG